jgi:AbrB family looped-hinge helix DNA binding protein
VSKAVAVTVDSKGRVTIPAEAREALGVEPGTVLFVEREGDVLRLAKAVNPFDGLPRRAPGRAMYRMIWRRSSTPIAAGRHPGTAAGTGRSSRRTCP